MDDILKIGWEQVAIASAFLFLSIVLSYTLKLNLEGSIILGGIRTFGQLLVLGYVVEFVLKQESLAITVGIMVLMIMVASINAFLMEKPNRFSTLWIFLAALALAFGLVILPIAFLILELKPWFDPQYLIPFGGMIIGNSMTAGMLASSNLKKLVRANSALVETKLALGGSYVQSTYPELVDAVRNGMLPTVNSLMIVGIIHIPGIFGGVVLSGVSPTYAAKYQIIVMYMLVMASAITTIIVAKLTLKTLFTHRHQLKFEEL